MRLTISILMVILSGSFLLASSLFTQIDHQAPTDVILGDELKLEVNNLNINMPIYEAKVFYKMQGEGDFRSENMKQTGYLFTVNIPTKQFRAGNLEYYFAFQTSDEIDYLPENTPQLNPFEVQILPDQQQTTGSSGGSLDVLLISPDVEEVLSPEEFVIAISLPIDPNQMQNYRYTLLLGGIDESSRLEQEGNLISYVPRTIRSGLHNAEFKVFDHDGRIVGEKSFSFRISGQPGMKKGYSSRTNIFLDNRYQNISESSDDLFRGGIYFSGAYQKLAFRARILVSSEESYDRQPINQYGGELQFNFTPTMNLYLKGGDFRTNYDQLVFWEKRVRGIGGGYNSRYFDLDVTYGQTLKAVEGEAKMVTDTLVSSGQRLEYSRYGTYKKSFLGIQPKIKVGNYLTWGLNLVNGKDDPGSIKYGANPKEALVIGTTLNMQFDNNRVQLKGSLQASMKNEDAVGEVEFDTLADRYNLSGSEKDLAENLYSFLESTGFLTLSQGLSPMPNLAMQFQTQLKYFNQVFQFMYKNIEADYTTPGNPYLLKDIRGFFVNDNIRLVGNQLFLNLYFNSFQDNLSRDMAKTDNTQYGATVSYYPFKNLPGISVMFGNQTRKNELAKNNISPDSTFMLIEDNTTRRLGLSSSYKFVTGSVKNTVSLSASNFKRDDKAYTGDYADRSSSSDFTLYTIGLNNNFEFPLTTKLSYSKTASLFGKSDFERKTDINRMFLGAAYEFKKVVMEGDIAPYLNYTYQSVSDLSNISYNRTNYTAGFYFRTQTAGTFTFRFDFIDYGSYRNYSDTILSTRYELNL